MLASHLRCQHRHLLVALGVRSHTGAAASLDAKLRSKCVATIAIDRANEILTPEMSTKAHAERKLLKCFLSQVSQHVGAIFLPGTID